MAEASASDAARIIAMKQEVEDEMAASHGGSSSRPLSRLGDGLKDPRQTLKTMRAGTLEWYKHMDGLHVTLDEQLEVT